MKFSNKSSTPDNTESERLPFLDVLRRRLFYLEGLADALDEQPRRALRTWVDQTRRIINEQDVVTK